MSTHTEGEWAFHPAGDNPRADHRAIATFVYLDSPADGVLIAASPDMYAALSYAIDNPEFDSEEFDRLARAALAKARPK
jgi:hypothetical protein